MRKIFEPLVDENAVRADHVGMRLREIRKMAGLTQVEVAQRLNIGQSAVTRMEQRQDILVSTLRDYLCAVGADLQVTAHFEDHNTIVSNLREAQNSVNDTDQDQLTLPLFGEDIPPNHRDIVFSIKPQYTKEIVNGRKTVELRRRFPLSVPKGTVALIYCTSPTRALAGIAEIGRVHKLSTKDIWSNFSHRACVTRPDFDEYFKGLELGFAIELSHARELQRPVELRELRDRFNFEPPQSYLYASPQMREAIQYECYQIPD